MSLKVKSGRFVFIFKNDSESAGENITILDFFKALGFNEVAEYDISSQVLYHLFICLSHFNLKVRFSRLCFALIFV